MVKEASPLLGMEGTEERFPVFGSRAARSWEQRIQVQGTEDSNTQRVVIQLSEGDFSRLRALVNHTTIPLSILARALLRHAISRYSLPDGLDDLFLQPVGIPPTNSLSKREADILNLIAQGLSNRGIANTFGLSEQTVKNHVSLILNKMKAKNRTQAALLAFRQNLVQTGTIADVD